MTLDKCDFVKIKGICSLKDSVKHKEKKLANYIFDKVLISRIKNSQNPVRTQLKKGKGSRKCKGNLSDLPRKINT